MYCIQLSLCWCMPPTRQSQKSVWIDKIFTQEGNYYPYVIPNSLMRSDFWKSATYNDHQTPDVIDDFQVHFPRFQAFQSLLEFSRMIYQTSLKSSFSSCEAQRLTWIMIVIAVVNNGCSSLISLLLNSTGKLARTGSWMMSKCQKAWGYVKNNLEMLIFRWGLRGRPVLQGCKDLALVQSFSSYLTVLSFMHWTSERHI